MSNNNNGFPSNGATSGNHAGTNGSLHSPAQPGADENGQEIELRHLFYLLWGNKWVITGILIFCVFLAALVAFLQTPIYQSEGSLMIKKSQNQYSYAGSDLGNLLTNSYGIGLGSSIGDELQMLQSRRLSKRVADSLMERRLMPNGEQYPVLFEDYPDDSTMALKETVAHRIRQGLAFRQVSQESNLINISFESPSPLEAANLVNLTIKEYSQLSTKQNRKSANSAVQFLDREKTRVQHKLHLAEQNLEQYMNKHKLVQIDEQTKSLIDRTADLQKRLQETRALLVAANAGIKQYQNQLDEIKPGLADQFASAIGPNMTRLQYKLAELKTKKMQLLSENPRLKNSNDPPKELRNVNRQIEDYKSEIRSQTYTLLNKGDQYLSMLGSGSDNMAQKVSDLQQKLISLKVQQQQYQSQKQVLTEQINKLNKVFDDLPENMTNLVRLKRKATINQELYLTVSKQQAQMALWKQTQFGEGQLVDEGYIPDDPIKPNEPLYLLVGFVLGGILAVGYVFTREAFNTTIDGTEKLKQFDVPMLAVVPDMQPFINDQYNGSDHTEVRGKQVSTRMVSLLDSVSPAAESFRRLESNLLHSNPDTTLKSLVVTSTTKGEGKTTVAANLGIIMAEADENVIIVDTDLRRPNLHNMFGLERAPGIVDVLFENTSLKEVIKPTVVPNLHMLSAGNRPPNPSSITKSSSFLTLIKELEQKYDRVILDTPPFGIITDSSSLIDQSDGVVMVCRFNKTKTGALEHTLQQLNRVGAHVMGTVLNGFDAGQSSDYYYGNNYYNEFYRDYAAYEEV